MREPYYADEWVTIYHGDCREVLPELSGIETCITDPLMGSGSTIFAAKESGRPSIGIDIDEHYCEVAANRCAQGVLDLEGVHVAASEPPRERGQRVLDLET